MSCISDEKGNNCVRQVQCRPVKEGLRIRILALYSRVSEADTL